MATKVVKKNQNLKFESSGEIPDEEKESLVITMKEAAGAKDSQCR
jgi:hypothetical protein